MSAWRLIAGLALMFLGGALLALALFGCGGGDKCHCGGQKCECPHNDGKCLLVGDRQGNVRCFRSSISK